MDAAWALYEAWGEDPHRRRGHRAGVRVRQVIRWRPAAGARAAARPPSRWRRWVWPDSAEHRGAAGQARDRGWAVERGRDGRRRGAQPRRRGREPGARSCPARSPRRNCLSASPTSPTPLPRARLRAGVGDGAAVVILASAERGQRACASGPPGSPGSSTGSTPAALGARDLRRRRHGGRRRACGGSHRRRHRRAARAVHPSGDPRRAARSASVTTSASTRPAACALRQPHVRRWAGPDRGGPRRRSRVRPRAARALAHATSGLYPCSRTSSA